MRIQEQVEQIKELDDEQEAQYRIGTIIHPKVILQMVQGKDTVGQTTQMFDASMNIDEDDEYEGKPRATTLKMIKQSSIQTLIQSKVDMGIQTMMKQKSAGIRPRIKSLRPRRLFS